MCLYPKLIKNKKYQSNKKNGGKIPPVCDERTLYVPVGCGKCIECKKQKAREWQVRLQEEIRENSSGKFVTLTFTDEALAELKIKLQEKGYNGLKIEDNEIATLGVRYFLERWRKKHKKSVRHWLVTELGQTKSERIHLHGILFTDESKEEIEKIWSYGMIWVGTFVNEKTINYIVKYINKTDEKHKGYNSKVLCSKGIGAGFIMRSDSEKNIYKGSTTKEYYKTRNGTKLALPIYYRNKIYSEEERELLWLNKLDKNERWVCGEKIDVKDNDDEYWRTLEHYRVINKSLGYGDDTLNWDKELYKRRKQMLKMKLI